MTTVLPTGNLLGRPSWGLALCAFATLVPTVWLFHPHANTAPPTFVDLIVGCVFLIPQLLALALSTVRQPAGRVLTLVAASLGLALSVLAVPLYLIGTLFVVQAGVATTVAARRLP